MTTEYLDSFKIKFGNVKEFDRAQIFLLDSDEVEIDNENKVLIFFIYEQREEYVHHLRLLRFSDFEVIY